LHYEAKAAKLMEKKLADASRYFFATDYIDVHRCTRNHRLL